MSVNERSSYGRSNPGRTSQSKFNLSMMKRLRKFRSQQRERSQLKNKSSNEEASNNLTRPRVVGQEFSELSSHVHSSKSNMCHTHTTSSSSSRISKNGEGNPKSFVCYLCSHEYPRESTLKNHLKVYHKVEQQHV